MPNTARRRQAARTHRKEKGGAKPHGEKEGAPHRKAAEEQRQRRGANGNSVPSKRNQDPSPKPAERARSGAKCDEEVQWRAGRQAKK